MYITCETFLNTYQYDQSRPVRFLHPAMTPQQPPTALEKVPNVPPLDASYPWECPARYQVFHKHADGRPLCQFCQCWNPAPFPDGRLPPYFRPNNPSGNMNSEIGTVNSVSGIRISLFLIDIILWLKITLFCR